MDADLIPAALARLRPGNRALLDLSLRRGVSDAEIAELLRKDEAEVARGRDELLDLLAHDLRVTGENRREQVREALQALPDAAWRGAAPAAPPPEPPRPEPHEEAPAGADEDEPAAAAAPRRSDEGPSAEEEPGGADEPAAPRAWPHEEQVFFDPPQKRRSRRGWLVAIAAIAALIVIGLLLLVGGGDDEADEPAPTTTQGERTQPAPPAGSDNDNDSEDRPPAEARGVPLEPVRGERGQGRISVDEDGERMSVAIRGLRRARGGYEVWLYDSIVDARSLGRFEGTQGDLQVRLPENALDYRFIDVSREPRDRNPNHSGDSVMRVPLDEVLAR